MVKTHLEVFNELAPQLLVLLHSKADMEYDGPLDVRQLVCMTRGEQRFRQLSLAVKKNRCTVHDSETAHWAVLSSGFNSERALFPRLLNNESAVCGPAGKWSLL